MTTLVFDTNDFEQRVKDAEVPRDLHTAPSGLELYPAFSAA
jgi:hypothetical protein